MRTLFFQSGGHTPPELAEPQLRGPFCEACRNFLCSFSERLTAESCAGIQARASSGKAAVAGARCPHVGPRRPCPAPRPSGHPRRPLVRAPRRSLLTTAASTSGRGRRRSLVLLDRDGVINEDVGSPGVCRVDDFRLVPGAAAAIARLNRAGATVCVVTNQTCVGKGLVTELELDGIHRRLRDALREEGGEDASIDRILVATTVSTVPCDRRKPNPGMVLEAMAATAAPGETCRPATPATDMAAPPRRRRA